MPDILLPGFNEWPEQTEAMDPAEIVKLYYAKASGMKDNPEEKEALRDQVVAEGGYAYGDQAASAFGLMESGAGQLSVPFVYVLELWPGCWPGPAQVGPDCVSKNQRNANLGSWSFEIAAGKPDEVTGRMEGQPYVSPLGIANGVLSSEVAYAERGHRGGGANCGTVAQAARKKAGCVLRQNYPEAGVNLEKYNYSYGANLGGRGLPSAMLEVGRKVGLIRTVTECSGKAEVCRDMLHNGYFLSTCGGESWSAVRDSFGFSKRTAKGWAHAIAGIAWDERPVIIEKFGEPLIAPLNSWAKWNNGPRDIYQSAPLVPPGKRDLWIRCGIVNPETGNIMLPHGAWWSRWSDFRRRYVCAVSSVDGWPRRKLLDWGVIL